jgi:hypothetical protein
MKKSELRQMIKEEIQNIKEYNTIAKSTLKDNGFKVDGSLSLDVGVTGEKKLSNGKFLTINLGEMRNGKFWFNSYITEKSFFGKIKALKKLDDTPVDMYGDLPLFDNPTKFKSILQKKIKSALKSAGKVNESLNESKGKAVRVASYSKAKTVKDFAKIMAKNPKNPPIDMTLFNRPQGPYGTPEEYRDHFGWTQLTVIGPRDSYRVVIVYENGKWVQGQ